MACNCTCTCPLAAGDPIRYRPTDCGAHKDVRINDGLELTLQYLGSRYVVYTWVARSMRTNEVVDTGETLMTREDFDEKIERDTRRYG